MGFFFKEGVNDIYSSSHTVFSEQKVRFLADPPDQQGCHDPSPWPVKPLESRESNLSIRCGSSPPLHITADSVYIVQCLYIQDISASICQMSHVCSTHAATVIPGTEHIPHLPGTPLTQVIIPHLRTTLTTRLILCDELV